MTRFKKNNDEWTVSSGKYAIVGSNSTGHILIQKTQAHVKVGHLEETIALKTENLEIFVIPIGKDDKGSIARSICVGNQGIISFGHLALIPAEYTNGNEETRRLSNGIFDQIYVEFHDTAKISFNDPFVDLNQCKIGALGEPLHYIDVKTPGIFMLDNLLIDMNVELWADVFGYGSVEFNEGLDDEGIFFNLVDVRDSLRKSKNPMAPRLLACLAGKGPFGTLKYAIPIKNE